MGSEESARFVQPSAPPPDLAPLDALLPAARGLSSLSPPVSCPSCRAPPLA